MHTDRGLTLSIDDSHSLMAQRVKAVLAVPLISDERPIGAIYLDHLKRSDAFAVVEMRRASPID